MTAVATVEPKPRAKLGAPTTYREEYCEALVEYFEARKLAMVTVTPDGSAAAQARAVCSSVPTLQGFAGSIGVTVTTLCNWANQHKPFFEARARAKAMQEQWFADALSTGIANPTGAIFVAKNMLGWRDKIDIEQTVNAGEDSINGGKLREALNMATPEQLAQFGALIEAMQANRPAIAEPTT